MQTTYNNMKDYYYINIRNDNDYLQPFSDRVSLNNYQLYQFFVIRLQRNILQQ